MNTNRPADEVTVMIVEDDPASRERFSRAVAAATEGYVVVTFDNGTAALRWLETNKPDVLLCDLGLPDIPGMSVIAYCAQRYPACDSMVITLYEDEEHVVKSLEAGASGYLLKDSVQDEIMEHVRVLRAGGAPMTPIIARQLLKRFRAAEAPAQEAAASNESGLTPRELVILTRIAQGFSYSEIADVEHLSRHTVHSHIKRIYSKLAVHSRSEAVFEANSMGLLKMR